MILPSKMGRGPRAGGWRGNGSASASDPCTPRKAGQDSIVTKPSCPNRKSDSMTGDPPVLNRAALWAALSNMQIKVPGAERRFEAVLAEQQSWPLAFAERVTGEYRRFLFLAATAGFEVTPSRSVDEAWHLHLALPHYRDGLCEGILGRPLDHLPGTGSEEDDARCARQYDRTLELYERVFGSSPPGDVWPRPSEAQRAGPAESDAAGKPLGIVAALGAIAGLGALLLGVPVPGSLLVAASILLGLVSNPSRAWAAGPSGRKGSAGCGGSCGGGADSGGSGCCASCGGGCGGD